MTLNQFYFFMCGAVLVLMVLIIWIAFIIPSINKWNKRFFVGLFAVFLACVISMAVELLTYGKPSLALEEKITVYFEYLLISIPVPMFTAYLLHTCGEDWRRSWLFRIVGALWGIYFILLAVAQGTTIFYHFTPDNLYVRDSWHLLIAAPAFAGMLLNLAGVIRRRKKLSRKYYAAFLIHLLALLGALFVHNVIAESLVLVALGMSVSTLAMFGIILYEQVEQYVSQQREIANQRANIMVLQMRPHFIYNAMMSIYYLCARDAKKAQQVTLDFTTYLRKNFNAIASEETIPFDDELEHIRAYLAIEQVQFEESLLVEYDTPCRDFRLPPLTLQPIVENAVKHGMDPESAPLCISIITRATDSGIEILVEDSGPGFEPVGDFEPHTALANIRQRLKIMCGGDLAVRLRDGGGTVVIVTVPKLN